MDQICCLLQLCCPPEEREAHVTAWIMTWGVEQDAAGKCARGLIKAFDESPLGHFMKAVAKVVREHP